MIRLRLVFVRLSVMDISLLVRVDVVAMVISLSHAILLDLHRVVVARWRRERNNIRCD